MNINELRAKISNQYMKNDVISAKEAKEIVVAAMEHADKSPWPDPLTLEEGVYA